MYSQLLISILLYVYLECYIVTEWIKTSHKRNTFTFVFHTKLPTFSTNDLLTLVNNHTMVTVLAIDRVHPPFMKCTML